MITARRNTNGTCINPSCKKYHKMIVGGEPRGILALDRLGNEIQMCMTCVIESRGNK